MKDYQDTLLELAAECYADPVRFAEIAFDWGHGDLIDFDGLDTWQRDFLEELGRDIVDAEANDKPVRKATASGHGIGKSALVAIIILWYMTTRPRARIRVTANTEKQLLGTTWPELALWHKRSIFKDWFLWEATRFSKIGDRENWFAEAISWNENNPDAFAGLHGRYVMLIMDEASGVADSIWETALGVLTDAGNTHLAFGNPIRPSGGFYDCFYHPKKSKRWKTRHINALETKIGNSQSNREIFEDYGPEHDVTRRRVLGQFPRQAASQFISTADVEGAMNRQLEYDDYANFPVYMGVDVARFGDDRSCILLRQGPKVLDIQTFEGADTVQVANIATGVLKSRKDIQMVFVDEVGVGAGVVDMMRRYDDRVTGVNVGRRPTNMKLYKNLRVELWDKMRQDIPKMDLPSNESLKRELTTIEYDFTDQGQMRLERKIDIKRRGLESPDIADALALTYARPDGAEFEMFEDDDVWEQREYAGRSRITGY